MAKAATRPAPPRVVLYYVRGADDALYRRVDGDPSQLPDEVLTMSGWMRLHPQLTVSATAYPRPSRRGTVDGGGDPALWTELSHATPEEAQRWAEENGRPQAW